MTQRPSLRLCIAALATCLTAPFVLAQMPPGPGNPPGGQPGGRSFGGGFGMRMGPRILPPGMWWKDQDLVQRLELTPDQQKRIDDSFLQNKDTLTRMHAGLDSEEAVLEPMLNSNPIDQARVLAEIGKIADMRAELEKATARMLLQVRGVLTQTQWSRLQQERPGGMRPHMYMRGPYGGSRGRMDGPPPPQQ
jgi:Spy/CpxP family protein refolding chaperone